MNGYCAVLFRYLKNRLADTALGETERTLKALFDCRYASSCPDRGQCQDAMDYLVGSRAAESGEVAETGKTGETACMGGVPVSRRYSFRTLDDAIAVTEKLKVDFPETGDVETALWELMINAIEHGNLGIGFDRKSDLLENGVLLDEIQRRLDDPVFGKRHATLEVKKTPGKLRIAITDEGPGFDWRGYVDRDMTASDRLHGRGIIMAKQALKTLTYSDRGNTAVVEFP